MVKRKQVALTFTDSSYKRTRRRERGKSACSATLDFWWQANVCKHTQLATYSRSDEKMIKDFGIEGGTVLHVRMGFCLSQLVLSLRGGL